MLPCVATLPNLQFKKPRVTLDDIKIALSGVAPLSTIELHDVSEADVDLAISALPGASLQVKASSRKLKSDRPGQYTRVLILRAS